MTFSAHGHVLVGSSDQSLVIFTRGTEREAGVLFAQLADGGQFLNLLALGDELEDSLEGAAEESAMQHKRQ